MGIFEFILRLPEGYQNTLEYLCTHMKCAMCIAVLKQRKESEDIDWSEF